MEDFRVVTGVSRGFDYERWRQELKKVDLEANVRVIPAARVQGQVRYVNKNQESITLADGVMIAYQYSRICWQKGEVSALVLDQIRSFSSERNCPVGTTRFYTESMKGQ